jgi:hypothetical protein
MKVVLKPGDTFEVELHETDGRFEIKYDVDLGHLTVTSDLPDTQGREGVIYDEVFLSPQGRMIDALENGEDPHLDLAERVFGSREPQDAVTRQRTMFPGMNGAPPPRKFYKTNYWVEVLRDEPIPEEMELADVLALDDVSVDLKSQTVDIVGPQTMRKLLIDQRSSPEFLGIENGDEIDFKDVVFERDGVRVTWMWIGEGVDGEFDFKHASDGDEPRLRVDVVVLKSEHESDTFSYCTLAPTWTSREGLERMTNELVRRLYADPQNPRNVVEMWTHLTRPDPAEMGGGVE